MHISRFSRIVFCLIAIGILAAETRSSDAQQDPHAGITVAVFGDYAEVKWQAVSTGVMIGHIGNELHYVLTVLSPCRQRPTALWVLRETESRVGSATARPSDAREASVISTNPYTGLSLLVFHQKDPSGTLSAFKPGILSDAELRAEPGMQFRALYVAEDNPPDKVVFAWSHDEDLTVSFRPLGALLSQGINLPASAIGAPVFDMSGKLAGLLNADAWDASAVVATNPTALCERLKDKAFLYPMSHAMDIVAHFTANLTSTRQIEELSRRLATVERKLKDLARSSEEELLNVFKVAADAENAERMRHIIGELSKLSPGLDSSTTEAVLSAMQKEGVDEAVLREGAVLLYKNSRNEAESVIEWVVYEKVVEYLASRADARAWMEAISEMPYPWVSEAVWFWLTGDDLSEEVKRHVVDAYAGLRCDDEVRTIFRGRLAMGAEGLDPILVEDMEYILSTGTAEGRICDRTGDLS